MMIEIDDGVFVNPKLVAVVKAVDDEQCALFTAGQSATDGGFLIDREAADVAEEITSAEDEEDEEED